MKQPSRFRNARRLLLFWTIFVGVGAVGGPCCWAPAAGG